MFRAGYLLFSHTRTCTYIIPQELGYFVKMKDYILKNMLPLNHFIMKHASGQQYSLFHNADPLLKTLQIVVSILNITWQFEKYINRRLLHTTTSTVNYTTHRASSDPFSTKYHSNTVRYYHCIRLHLRLVPTSGSISDSCNPTTITKCEFYTFKCILQDLFSPRLSHLKKYFLPILTLSP